MAQAPCNPEHSALVMISDSPGNHEGLATPLHHIPNLIKNYCRFTQNFSSHFQNSCLCGMPCTNSLPIMLALCSMLLPSYYAPNYAGIIWLRPTCHTFCDKLTWSHMYHCNCFLATYIPAFMIYRYKFLDTIDLFM